MSQTVNLPTTNFQEAAGLLNLLASLWGQEVDAATLKAMMQPAFSEAWKESGGKLPSQISAELLADLQVDYCQLLIGPKNHVPPVQSIWDQARFQGDATASMKKYIELLDGFQPCVGFVDHVAVQLQYASALMSLSHQSRRKLMQGLATAFARDHLQWSLPFFNRVEQQAQTGFYQSVARVSRQFLFGPCPTA